MAAELITLGLLTLKKWDRARADRVPGFLPPPEELARVGNLTETELAELRHLASATLADLAPSGWTEWWWSVSAGIVASFIWAVLLIIIGVIAIKSSGGDLGDVVRRLVAPTHV